MRYFQTKIHCSSEINWAGIVSDTLGVMPTQKKKTAKEHASPVAARVAKHRAKTARLDRQIPVETMERLQQLADKNGKTVVAMLVELVDQATKRKK